MGNRLSLNSPNPEDVDVKPEQIHKILLSIFSKLTNSKNSFDERKTILDRVYQKYKPYVNPLFPHIYQFTKTSFEYEIFVFIGTIGTFAIDMVAYYDLFDWIVLNDRTNFRSYQTSGSSKLQHCVSKRKTAFTSEDKAQLDSKKREVDTIISTLYNDDYENYTTDILDEKTKTMRKVQGGTRQTHQNTTRSTQPPPIKHVPTKEVLTPPKPTKESSNKLNSTKSPCKILIPEENEKVDCEFLMDLEFGGWEMSKTRGYKILIDGETRGAFNNIDPISMNFHGCNKGIHVIEIQLVDSGEVVFSTRRQVILKADCSHTVTTGSDSDSGSDAMSDSTISTSITSTTDTTATSTSTVASTSDSSESDSFEFPPRSQRNSKTLQQPASKSLPQSSRALPQPPSKSLQQSSKSLPRSSKSPHQSSFSSKDLPQSSKDLPQSSKSLPQSSKSLPQSSKSPRQHSKSIADLIIKDDSQSDESDSYSSSCLIDPYESSSDEDIRKILEKTTTKTSTNGLSSASQNAETQSCSCDTSNSDSADYNTTDTTTDTSRSDTTTNTTTVSDSSELDFQISPKAQNSRKTEDNYKVQKPKVFIKYVRNSVSTDSRSKKK